MQESRRSDRAEPAGAAWLPAGTVAGQTAVVTGGGTGLGAEISRALAALGARVVIASRSAEHHAPLLAEAAERGWAMEAIALDVREPVEVERAALELAERGGVDILVNNAAGNFLCPAERLSARGWRAVVGIALDGTFYCSRYFGRTMIERVKRQRRDGDGSAAAQPPAQASAGGQILNIVATYAWTGMPGVVHSASAKAGVLAMTRTLAVEWARFGIRVNAIAPGPFETEGASSRLWPQESMRERLIEQIPLRRMAEVGEVAVQCLHLLSPASAYVNGECLVLDGGASLGSNMWSPGERRS